jgi:hypothetical protein
MNDVGIRDYVHAEMLYTKEQDDKEVFFLNEDRILAWYKSFFEVPEGYTTSLEFIHKTTGLFFYVSIFDDSVPSELLARFCSHDYYYHTRREYRESLKPAMDEFADKVKKLCK